MKLFPAILVSIWTPMICSATTSEVSHTLRVLPEMVNRVETRKLLRHYMLEQAEEAFQRREAAFEKLKTPGRMRAHQRRLREYLRSQLGDFPERTPLEARVVARHKRDGYSIERILYQSRPGHHVTALLYLPEGTPPYPGVLIACGHAATAKSSEM
jgi:hypothetical protein